MTLTSVACSARLKKNSRISGLSIGGFVSGLVTIVVIPPAAAEAPADLKLSLCCSPGSHIFTPISIIPGAT